MDGRGSLVVRASLRHRLVHLHPPSRCPRSHGAHLLHQVVSVPSASSRTPASGPFLPSKHPRAPLPEAPEVEALVASWAEATMPFLGGPDVTSFELHQWTTSPSSPWYFCPSRETPQSNFGTVPPPAPELTNDAGARSPGSSAEPNHLPATAEPDRLAVVVLRATAKPDRPSRPECNCKARSPSTPDHHCCARSPSVPDHLLCPITFCARSLSGSPAKSCWARPLRPCCNCCEARTRVLFLVQLLRSPITSW